MSLEFQESTVFCSSLIYLKKDSTFHSINQTYLEDKTDIMLHEVHPAAKWFGLPFVQNR
jgi:hypothetical protein